MLDINNYGDHRMVRFLYFAFALALLTLPAAAQDKKDSAHPASAPVLINGKPIQGRVLEIDGKHYVAVEDLAQSLSGTIAYSDGRVALTLSQLPPVTAEPPSPEPPRAATQTPPTPPPSVAAQAPPSPPVSLPVQPTESGKITGKLTYFFEVRTGSTPDTGSKIWLVKGHVEIPEDQNFVATSTALGTGKNPEQYAAIQYSTANEAGTFELLDVPPGEYTLILQSAHTKGTLSEKLSFFNRGNGRTLRDSTGRIETLNLLVKAGETVEASKDFGPDIGK